ncbi:metallophosphoesterase [Virgibacillus salarius]|uniref:metallophosphoesterase n=1 Tax=Virgibacillus salarius TaxID=447199 RepID=UPI0003F979C8|nr:metallophosphoesterase [Priestia megaterium]
MMNASKLALDKNRRMIVISDIHGNLQLLQKLLDKIAYTPEDYLFINGDMCEKGADSLGVIDFLTSLTAQLERVYVTKGNCDILINYVFNEVEGIKNYMKKQPNSILNEMLKKQDKSLADFHSLKDLSKFYRTHYKNEIDWLEALPIAYETEHFIIIHAGIEDIPNWQSTTIENALSMPAFYEKGHRADKTVIVGHWPVVNYTTQSICSNNPLIDLDKRIIAIDGGNQIKREGQLNALVVDGEQISFTFVDELQEMAMIQQSHQDTTARVGTVTYPNYELEIIKEEPFFTHCKNIELGITQWVKNEFITRNNNQLISNNDISTTFLSVQQGEIIKVINNDCSGYTIIKNDNGEIGWIPKQCLYS